MLLLRHIPVLRGEGEPLAQAYVSGWLMPGEAGHLGSICSCPVIMKREVAWAGLPGPWHSLRWLEVCHLLLLRYMHDMEQSSSAPTRGDRTAPFSLPSQQMRNRSHFEGSLLRSVDLERNLSLANKSQTQRTECYSWQSALGLYERQIIRQEQTSSVGISGRDHCGGLLIKCLAFILSLHIIASCSWFDPANYVNHQSLEKGLGSWSPQEQCKPQQPVLWWGPNLRRSESRAKPLL